MGVLKLALTGAFPDVCLPSKTCRVINAEILTFQLNYLEFDHSIRDSIHGTIRLSKEELTIINSGLFFRLHQVKQNGLLYFVFPSAKHSRFEHSLGVLHMAEQLFRSLLRNSYGADKKKALAPNYTEASYGQAIPFHNLDKKILSDLNRVIRIAALVHDLGHGPFSHTFDAFAPKAESVALLINADERLRSIHPLLPLFHNRTADKLRVEHEEMSCFFFALICHGFDQAEQKDGSNFHWKDLPLLVAAVILGKIDLVPDSNIKPYIPLLHDMVASAPVDVDRMDYLERDSRSIGVTYGLYDRERLLKSFLVCKGRRVTNEGKEEECCRLGIKLSGVRAVENFIQARFELYVQVYYHKTNSSISSMLNKIADEARARSIEVLPEVSQVDDLMYIYTNIDDARFLRILQGKDADYSLKGSTGVEIVTTLATRIATRDLWKRVFEGRKENVKNVDKQLSAAGWAELISVEEIEAKATKSLKEGAVLLSRADDGIYSATPTQEGAWQRNSPMIAALEKPENDINRIYFVGVGLPDLEKLRHEVRQLSAVEQQNQ